MGDARPTQPRRAGRRTRLPLWGDQGDGRAPLRLRRRPGAHGLPRDTATAPACCRLSTSTTRTVCRPCEQCCAGKARPSVQRARSSTTGPRRSRSTAWWIWVVPQRRPLRSLPGSLIDATINWDADDAYADAGAPPNGSDYVRLRGGAGNYLRASQIRSIAFDGAETLPTLPVEWEVDPSPPGHEGDPALHSGSGSNLDRGDHLRGDGSRGAADAQIRDALRHGGPYGTTASSRSRPTVARPSGALRAT